eukprot:COSAG04_NODE_97_length_26459_cov_6.507246_1_plen_69_part_00
MSFMEFTSPIFNLQSLGSPKDQGQMTCRAHRGLEVTSETVRKTTHEFSNCQPQSSSHRLIVYAGQLFT